MQSEVDDNKTIGICPNSQPYPALNTNQERKNTDGTQSKQDKKKAKGQGPVVQSIVSLTSSLRGQLIKCFTTL